MSDNGHAAVMQQVQDKYSVNEGLIEELNDEARSQTRL